MSQQVKLSYREMDVNQNYPHRIFCIIFYLRRLINRGTISCIIEKLPSLNTIMVMIIFVSMEKGCPMIWGLRSRCIFTNMSIIFLVHLHPPKIFLVPLFIFNRWLFICISKYFYCFILSICIFLK